MREIRGEFLARGRRFALVVSRFNEIVTAKLLNACARTASTKMTWS